MELLIGAAAASIFVGIRHNMNRKNHEAEHKMTEARRKNYEAECKMEEAVQKVTEANRDRDDAKRKMFEAMYGGDGKGGLRRKIKNLNERLEMNDTELKLLRRQMELYEKKMELYKVVDARELEYCVIELEDGVTSPLLERDHEVEGNEYKMDDEIEKELQDISHELEDIKRESI